MRSPQQQRDIGWLPRACEMHVESVDMLRVSDILAPFASCQGTHVPYCGPEKRDEALFEGDCRDFTD